MRGLSILLVILNHIGLRIPLARTGLNTWLPRSFLVDLNYNGYEAVFVFFVISGFLITTNSLRRWGPLRQINLRAFYAQRFARIVPCLLALVAVLAVLDRLGFQDYVIRHSNQSLGRAIVAALALHLNWYEGHTGYLPGNWDVLWSLSIEEVFYIGFPVVCLLTRRTWVLVPLLLLLALSLPESRSALQGHHIWQEKAYLPGMAAIATGVLGALIVRYTSVPRRVFTTLLCGAGVVGLGAILFAGSLVWSTWHNGYMLLLTFSVICLVIGLYWREQAGWRRGLPGFGWLRACGRLSYEIYLTHMFVVYAAVRLYRAEGSHVESGYLWYLPIVFLCWLLGWVVAKYFSMPLDRNLRRRLLKPALSA